MRHWLISWGIAVLLVLIRVGPATAQVAQPPTIFRFDADVTSTTLADLEAGDGQITLTWHVAHVDPSFTLRLYAYQEYAWAQLHDPVQPLPFVGSLSVPLTHPHNFTPPTYRLVLLDTRGQTRDERTLVVPFAPASIENVMPMIDTFTTETQSVDAATIADQTLRLPVTWQVSNRLPQTNLIFEQVFDDNQVQNIELPRSVLWIPSAGSGVVAPVAPPNGSVIQLRLRVLDVITADVYDEKYITISVIGTTIPPEVDAALPQPTPSTAQVSQLSVTANCLTMANEGQARGWVDGDGIRAPNLQTIAYATNALGDSRLILANADGSGQVQIEAPDKTLALGLFPVWSPDSERIAFASSALAPPGGGEIYVVRRDGSDLRQIAAYTGYHDDLAWSEDGTRLYFTSGEASGTGAGMLVGNYQVYTVSADGFGTPAPVTAGCAVR